MAEPTPGRQKRREPWWLELVLIGVVYWIYSWVADKAPRDLAVHNGLKILSFERALGIDIEKSLNSWWVSGGHSVVVFGNLYYDLMHFMVPVATLLWVFIARHEIYARVRTPLLIVSLGALLVFWLW